MNIKAVFTILLSSYSLFSFCIEKDSCVSPIEELNYCLIEEVAVHNIIDTAITCIGTPYKYGGTTKKGFDCSGFLGFVFNSYCGSIPRSSSAISKIGEKISRSEIEIGDLIFFKGRNSGSNTIGHVSIVSEVNDGKITMIHSTRRGVVQDVLSEIKYYDSRYLFSIRLDYAHYLHLF